MASIESLDADWLLEQWVRWCRSGEGGVRQALSNMLGSSMPSPLIDDEQALVVDGIVSHLLKTKPLVGGVVCSYYGHGKNYSVVSDIFGIERRRVASIVSEGVGWVDAKLDDHRCMDRVRRVFSCLRRGQEPDPSDGVVEELILFYRKAS